jgi:hypothetical protein
MLCSKPSTIIRVSPSHNKIKNSALTREPRRKQNKHSFMNSISAKQCYIVLPTTPRIHTSTNHRSPSKPRCPQPPWRPVRSRIGSSPLKPDLSHTRTTQHKVAPRRRCQRRPPGAATAVVPAVRRRGVIDGVVRGLVSECAGSTGGGSGSSGGGGVRERVASARCAGAVPALSEESEVGLICRVETAKGSFLSSRLGKGVVS